MYKDTRKSLLDCGIKEITLQGITYELDTSKGVSRGGSCLVYHALKKDSNKPTRDRKVILKEFYPYHKDSGDWRKADGRLVLPENKTEIESKKKQFEQSYDRFTELYNEGMDNNTVKPENIIINSEQGNSIYMVVDHSSGITLDDYMAQGIGLFEFFTVMENLAGVLGKLHGMGYIHMDVKPANILCLATNPEHPDSREMTRLLDTDSFIRKAAFSDEIEQNGLSTSLGYAAPEVVALRYDMEDMWLRIEFKDYGERADMFSFGAIVYEYIFGELPEAPYERCHTYEERLEEYLQKKSRYIPYQAVCQIRNLLRTTLAEDPYDRYESMSEIEEEIAQILKLIDTGKVQILDNCCRNSDRILGREDKIQKLHKKLTDANLQGNRSRVVFVTGIGGIGKSSLAREYAVEYAENYDIKAEVSAASAVEAVQRIRILNDPMDGKTMQGDWIDQRKEMLTNLCKDYRTLLIVNDYDVSQDPEFRIWLELGCDVILTSRHDWSENQMGIPVVTLNCLDLQAEVARDIFTEYYKQGARTDSDKQRLNEKLTIKTIACDEKRKLAELLQRINYHPLAMKLIARYMTAVPGQELSPSQALADEELFRGTSLITITDNPDWAMIETNVYTHIKNLFQKAKKLSHLGFADLKTLRYMLLVPSGDGISAERLKAWTAKESISSGLERLYKNGWLEYLPERTDVLDSEESGESRGVYIMPTILQQLLQEDSMMKCDTDNCYTFIKHAADSVWNWKTFQQRRAFLEQEKHLVQILNGEETPDYAVLLHWTAFNYLEISSQYDQYLDTVIEYEEKALAICENIEDVKLKWKILDTLISCYMYKRDWEKALYYRKGMDEQDVGVSDWVDAQRNLSHIYWEKGKSQSAIDTLYIAWKECEKNKDVDLLSRIMVADSMGIFLTGLGLPEEADAFFQTAESLCRAAIASGTAEAFLGSLSSDLKHSREALFGKVGKGIGLIDYHEAMSHMYKVQSDFGELFYTYSFLEPGFAEGALVHFKYAAEIAMELYGEESSQIAFAWDRMASAYARKNDLEKARVFRKKALDILLGLEEYNIAAKVCQLQFLFDHETWDERCEILWNSMKQEYHDFDIYVADVEELLAFYWYMAQEELHRGNIDRGLQQLEIYLILYNRYHGDSDNYAKMCCGYADELFKYERTEMVKFYLKKADEILRK